MSYLITDSWLVLAAAAALCWAIVNVIDKLIVERMTISTKSILLLATSMEATILLPLLLRYRHIGGEFSLYDKSSLIALFSGLFVALFTYSYYTALRTLDAPIVAVLLQTIPLATLLIGVIFLGEVLSPASTVGVAIMIVAAAAIAPLSLETDPGTGSRRRCATKGNRWQIVMLITGIVAMAVSYAMQKSSSAHLTALQVFLLSRIGALLATTALAYHRTALTELKLQITDLSKTHSLTKFIVALATQSLINIAGVYLIIEAYRIGPLSLVVTATALQPAFVVILILLINWQAPEYIPDRHTSQRTPRLALTIVLMILSLYLIHK